ncbi:MAG: hypothetical protein ACI4L6_02790 [Candidatus Onthoplasma sp.]
MPKSEVNIMKHLIKILSLRAIIMGAITTGLCFLFPGAIIPISIIASVSYLISAVASVEHAKSIGDEMDTIPTGDLKYYEFKAPGTSLENKIVNTVDKLEEQCKERNNKQENDTNKEKTVKEDKNEYSEIKNDNNEYSEIENDENEYSM